MICGYARIDKTDALSGLIRKSANPNVEKRVAELPILIVFPSEFPPNLDTRHKHRARDR